MDEYTVDWFIDFFSKIPARKWCTNVQHEIFTGRKCAVGHLSLEGEGVNVTNSPRLAALRDIFREAGICSPSASSDRYLEEVGWTVADINNGDHPDYQQDYPKDRILSALVDVKIKLGEYKNIKTHKNGKLIMV